jgi:hypothetical protein
MSFPKGKATVVLDKGVELLLTAWALVNDTNGVRPMPVLWRLLTVLMSPAVTVSNVSR